ncbi:DNA (cytosine-5)-methyltransferase 1 [Bacillus sp. OV322]|uniref:DNA (cytosine-5-)-methyltransferase n=1 Tax=Bacillus sp. OV322 TaxID=1882764 RepID=UPI0008E80F4B|nr:DNA (cytosine-5-)-methyltransferase [Bacillus sp. OV322]SFB99010.1 DNA (cytosine-5)-methyltransferase 1 [Bacillus sp. OV322]
MKLKVFSMFDGVGGFIHGLNNANEAIGEELFDVIYSNQFEPSRKSQDAYEVGMQYFGNKMEHIPTDIMKVEDCKFEEMRDNNVNMIVGGFPCQDYSVARSKKNEQGIEGKKGVLFWEIIRVTSIIKPDYLILENVDRLLKSPSNQRGRDFAVMLGAFNNLGYSVEWRVINAADYGRAQKRRRVFFFIYRNNTEWAKKVDLRFEQNGIESLQSMKTPIWDSKRYDDYLLRNGLFARQFPVESVPKQDGKKIRHYSAWLGKETKYDEYVLNISENFTGTIWNTGVMRHGRYYTIDTTPIFEPAMSLGEVKTLAKNFYIKNNGEEAYKTYIKKYWITDEAKLAKFNYLRGPKKIERTTEDGHKWMYSEGGMSPYDSFNSPARTMLTSEGSVNRSTHFLFDDGHYRLLTPNEAELLQDFPLDSTRWKMDKEGNVFEVSDRMRYFFMGNALVTGIVKRIAQEIKIITSESVTLEI